MLKECLLDLKHRVVICFFPMSSQPLPPQGQAPAGIQKIMKQYYVYILASKRNGTLYTGITSDLIKRVYEHKNKLTEGFTKKYDVNILVHYEIFEDPENAIIREKRIKAWKRKWKLRLIEEENPHWDDLYESLI